MTGSAPDTGSFAVPLPRFAQASQDDLALQIVGDIGARHARRNSGRSGGSDPAVAWQIRALAAC